MPRDSTLPTGIEGGKSRILAWDLLEMRPHVVLAMKLLIGEDDGKRGALNESARPAGNREPKPSHASITSGL
eukprot:scaffold75943_cov21-Tisochrysis_lutea.AAC.1